MSNQTTSARGAQIKRKQLMLLAAGIAIFVVLAAGATYVMTSSTAPPKVAEKPPEKINMVTGGSAYSEREAWRTQIGSEVATMQKEWRDTFRQLAERDAKRDEEIKAAERRARDLAPPIIPAPASAASAAAAGAGGSSSALAPPPPLNLPPPPGRRANNGSFTQGPFDPPAGLLGAGGVPRDQIGTVTFEGPKTQAQGGALTDGESGGQFDKQQAGNYIPSGTFARVVVLNGLDAPTGGQSQQNPSPVLLQIIDNATLPNGYKVNLKNCILTGNGFGDVAAERANIRLDRMSCVDPAGGAIDLQVRGYVAGEDGKAGMRGRLVTKTGQMLANALLASVGSGIGEAFKSASETTTINPLGGATTTTNPGDGFVKGFGGGTQRAFDMLARYYITLAEKTFPIVEVDGGRVADIVFTRGFVIEGKPQQ
jgi:conjugal transfer pilus assembly protein TraB